MQYALQEKKENHCTEHGFVCEKCRNNGAESTVNTDFLADEVMFGLCC